MRRLRSFIQLRIIASNRNPFVQCGPHGRWRIRTDGGESTFTILVLSTTCIGITIWRRKLSFTASSAEAVWNGYCCASMATASCNSNDMSRMDLTRPKSAFWLRHAVVFLLWTIAIGAVLLALSLPAVNGGDSPTLSKCRNNLKAIAFALHKYHEAYGSFPPATVRDSIGRPMHSWRILILPFFEDSRSYEHIDVKAIKNLYARYRFDEPWNSLSNQAIANAPMPVYACPGDNDTSRAGFTNYLAVVGPGTIWADPTRIEQIRDGTSHTILVVESNVPSIPWTQPTDLAANEMSSQDNSAIDMLSSAHPGGTNIAFADASVQFLSHGDTTGASLNAMLTMAGNDGIGESLVVVCPTCGRPVQTYDNLQKHQVCPYCSKPLQTR